MAPRWLSLFQKPPPKVTLDTFFAQCRTFVDQFLSHSVFWVVFGIFVATSGLMLGLFLPLYAALTSRCNSTNTKTIDTSSDKSTGPFTSDFYNLMSRVLITILACYCTLIPVLHVHPTGTKCLKIHDKVFYFIVVVTLATAIAAVVTRVTKQDTASSILNFVSSLFSVITAGQLAAGVMNLGNVQKRERLQLGSLTNAG